MIRLVRPTTRIPRPFIVIQRSFKSTLPDFQNVSSYLNYAKTKSLDTGSTVFNGTTYELTSIEVLKEIFCPIEMRHVGGADDKGIDALGSWDISAISTDYSTVESLDEIPSSLILQDTLITPVLSQSTKDPKINVLVQCKNYSRKITPKEIRELSGIYHNAFSREEEKSKSIVLFCAPSLMTKKGIEQLNNSNFPIGYCQISKMTQWKKGDKYSTKNYKNGKLQAFYANPVLLGILNGVDFLSYINGFIEEE